MRKFSKKSMTPDGRRTPDGLPSIMYCKLAQYLARPLSSIFEVSFRCHCLPTVWLTADIVPIFKKGDPSNPYNYRPVCRLQNYGIMHQGRINKLFVFSSFDYWGSARFFKTSLYLYSNAGMH